MGGNTTNPRWRASALIAWAIVLSLCICFGSGPSLAAPPAEKNRPPVEYYRALSGVGNPARPIGRITEAQAKTSGTYCAAYYEKNRLVRVVQIANGVTVLEQKYTYHSSGKISRVESTSRKARKVLEFPDVKEITPKEP